MSLEYIDINRFSYYLAKWIKVVYSMICSSLFPQIPLNVGESKIDFISCVVIMLLVPCYFMVNSWFISPFRHLYTCTCLRWKRLFFNAIHFRVAYTCDAHEFSGRSKIKMILAALFCKTRRLDIKNDEDFPLQSNRGRWTLKSFPYNHLCDLCSGVTLR